jgi:hypothetical protein
MAAALVAARPGQKTLSPIWGMNRTIAGSWLTLA